MIFDHCILMGTINRSNERSNETDTVRPFEGLDAILASSEISIHCWNLSFEI